MGRAEVKFSHTSRCGAGPAARICVCPKRRAGKNKVHSGRGQTRHDLSRRDPMPPGGGQRGPTAVEPVKLNSSLPHSHAKSYTFPPPLYRETSVMKLKLNCLVAVLV